MKISVTVGKKRFSAVLYQTKAAQEFAQKLPSVLRMRDYNRNEKFCELPNHDFTLEKTVPSAIRSGDIMLYGTDTLVIFYMDIVPNRYAYTPIGRIENAEELHSAMREDTVTVYFEL